MQRTVSREELLKQLESVTPGLSSREIIEQSSCFVFLDGKVATYNDEVACWTRCCLKLEGAVQATPLLNLLRKMPEESVDVSIDHNKLVVKGKRRRARLALESEITLNFKSVGAPKKWTPLPEDFLEAVNLVYRCAGKDEQNLEKYVHIHPEKVEGVSEHTIGHFRTKIELTKPVLVHKDSIKHVVSLGMIEFGQTKSWIHFRNAAGLVLSCRRWVEEDFPDTTKALSIRGTKIVLPKGLAVSSVLAGIFTTDNAEDDDVVVSLSPGKLVIVGSGASGDFREVKTVKYQGKAMTFMVSPKLLEDITKKHNDAWITPTTLKVKTGKFTFMTALGSMEDKNQEEESEE